MQRRHRERKPASRRGGKLVLEVDREPKYAYTYGLGASCAPFKHFDVAADIGAHMHGGWHVALVPALRF